MKINKKELLSQVQSERQQAINSCQNKRFSFRDRLKLYNDQQKEPEKVSINTLYSNIRMLMAMDFNDELNVTLIGREYSDNLKAKNWEKIIEYDKEITDLTSKKLDCKWNKYFYGVGILRLYGWDEDNKCGLIDSPDIMTWLPDPLGSIKADNFRFMGFENGMTKETMKEIGISNINDFKKLNQNEFYNWNPYNRINPNNEIDTNDEQKYYYVYDHYTIYNGKKILVTVDKDCSVIGRVIVFEELLGANLFPVSLFYYSPEKLNPYGTSVCDLLEDKQRALSKLANLAISKAVRSSLGGHKLYNKSKIPNRVDLAQLTELPKLIGVDIKPGESIQDAVYELPVNQVNQDNLTISNEIQYQMKVATGIDPITMGISAPGTQTATETQQIQANANLIFSYGLMIDFIGEKDFVNKYIKLIKKNLRGSKTVRITNDVSTQYFTIKQSELKSKSDFDIVITSAKEEKKKRSEKLQAMLQLVPFIQQQGGITWTLALRELFINSGFDYDEAVRFVRTSAVEDEAEMQVILLNSNTEIDLKDIKPEDDHDTYIQYYKTALDTDAKWKAIQARQEAKIKAYKSQQQGQVSGTMGMPQQQNSQLANSASNMLMANSLQQTKEPISTQNIAQP